MAGSAIQIGTLPVLSQAHAAGDAMARQAADTVWLAVVHGAQYGLWLFEGPTLGVWAIVAGTVLARRGQALGRPLVLVGICYLI